MSSQQPETEFVGDRVDNAITIKKYGKTLTMPVSVEPVFVIKESYVDENGVRIITDAELKYISVIGSGNRAVSPVDADDPLPEVETVFDPTGAELQRAANAFNTALPEYDGLLDAEVVED